jgi:hypothetical protein
MVNLKTEVLLQEPVEVIDHEALEPVVLATHVQDRPAEHGHVPISHSRVHRLGLLGALGGARERGDGGPTKPRTIGGKPLTRSLTRARRVLLKF